MFLRIEPCGLTPAAIQSDLAADAPKQLSPVAMLAHTRVLRALGGHPRAIAFAAPHLQTVGLVELGAKVEDLLREASQPLLPFWEGADLSPTILLPPRPPAPAPTPDPVPTPASAPVLAPDLGVCPPRSWWRDYENTLVESLPSDSCRSVWISAAHLRFSPRRQGQAEQTEPQKPHPMPRCHLVSCCAQLFREKLPFVARQRGLSSRDTEALVCSLKADVEGGGRLRVAGGWVSLREFARFSTWLSPALRTLRRLEALWASTHPVLIRPFVSRDQTIERLLGPSPSPAGTFLIRLSSDARYAGMLVISYTAHQHRKGGGSSMTVLHCLVKVRQDGQFAIYLGEPEEGRVFPDLPSLIMGFPQLRNLYPMIPKEDAFSPSRVSALLQRWRQARQ